jgi:hypothetical protein
MKHMIVMDGKKIVADYYDPNGTGTGIIGWSEFKEKKGRV